MPEKRTFSSLELFTTSSEFTSEPELDAGGKPSTMVHAGETRRAAAKGVSYFRRVQRIALGEARLASNRFQVLRFSILRRKRQTSNIRRANKI